MVLIAGGLAFTVSLMASVIDGGHANVYADRQPIGPYSDFARVEQSSGVVSDAGGFASRGFLAAMQPEKLAQSVFEVTAGQPIPYVAEFVEFVRHELDELSGTAVAGDSASEQSAWTLSMIYTAADMAYPTLTFSGSGGSGGSALPWAVLWPDWIPLPSWLAWTAVPTPEGLAVPAQLLSMPMPMSPMPMSPMPMSPIPLPPKPIATAMVPVAPPPPPPPVVQLPPPPPPPVVPPPPPPPPPVVQLPPPPPPPPPVELPPPPPPPAIEAPPSAAPAAVTAPPAPTPVKVVTALDDNGKAPDVFEPKGEAGLGSGLGSPGPAQPANKVGSGSVNTLGDRGNDDDAKINDNGADNSAGNRVNTNDVSNRDKTDDKDSNKGADDKDSKNAGNDKDSNKGGGGSGGDSPSE